MNQRYYSLDVFRGATVALMILVNNPGTWSYMFAPLKHAAWHGVTPTDLVFPFFLFAVGNAMAFVMPRLEAAGESVFWTKVIKRTLLIFLIGLALNWWPFIQWRGEDLAFRHWVDPENSDRGVRIFGVLQRIAVAYFFASILVHYMKGKKLIWASLGILIFYWILCYVFGSPGDPYSLSGWFGTAIDERVLGVAHMYKGEGVPFDPEGIMSAIPSAIQVVFGYLAGNYIRSSGAVDWIWSRLNPVKNSLQDSLTTSSNSEKHTVDTHKRQRTLIMLTGFLIIGILAALIGLAWGLVFPINKKIWTSSYVFYTTGLAMLSIGVMIWYIEVLGIKNSLTRFFDVFGKNPLFIFVLSGLLPKTLALFRWQVGINADGNPVYTTPLRWFYNEVCAQVPGPPEFGSFAYALCFLALCWGIAYLMDKKRIYIKV